MVNIADQTGLRAEEILSLQRSEVDLLRNTIAIWKQKNKESDTLLLNETALGVLRGRARHIRSPLVFYDEKGRKIQKGRLLFALHETCRKAGIEHMHFHDLGHTWASWLHQDGRIFCQSKIWENGKMVEGYKGMLTILPKASGRQRRFWIAEECHKFVTVNR